MVLRTSPIVGLRHVLGEQFSTSWGEDENLWESWRRTCDPKAQARRLFASIRPGSPVPPAVNRLDVASPFTPDHEGFAFAESVDDSFDFCENPWARFQQAHFFSDMRTIPVLYPVFSQAKAPGFADIRIPSHYYHQPSPGYTYGWDGVNMVFKEVDDGEVVWENKTDVIFWRGSMTGGGNTPPGFAAQYQRYRCVPRSMLRRD